MQGNPMDLLALVPLLVLLAYGLHTAKREARRQPDLTSTKIGATMDMDMICDREGEALPPFLASSCRDCAEQTCDRAEHVGLTDQPEVDR